MKKFLIIIIAIGAVIYLAVQVFNYYDSTHLLSNQAVFNIYLDLPESKVDSFFGLKKGTFDKKVYYIICQLPVTPGGWKPKSVLIKSDLSKINCARPFNKDIDIKYSASEINGNNFKLIVTRWGGSVAFFDTKLPIFQSVTTGYRDFAVVYKKGKINNIVITADSAYNYCAKSPVSQR